MHFIMNQILCLSSILLFWVFCFSKTVFINQISNLQDTKDGDQLIVVHMTQNLESTRKASCQIEKCQTKVFKKGRIFCYSCTSEYPSYSPLNATNITQYFTENLRTNLPESNEQCNEKHPTDDLKGLRKLRAVYCPDGVCVKVKTTLSTEDGSFKDAFVVRDCWSQFWDRPYVERHWINCSDASFLGDENAGKICSCHFDLCNSSSFLMPKILCIVVFVYFFQ